MRRERESPTWKFESRRVAFENPDSARAPPEENLAVFRRKEHEVKNTFVKSEDRPAPPVERAVLSSNVQLLKMGDAESIARNPAALVALLLVSNVF